MQEITIRSSSGLCNRIRLLTTALSHSQTVRMVWQKTTACPAYWHELFQPHPRVKIASGGNGKGRLNRQGRNLCILEFVPVFEIPKIGTSYIAAHIRRTDIETVLRRRKIRSISDEEFYAAIDRGLESNEVVFLATDNCFTQRRFAARYGNRLVTWGVIETNGSRWRPKRCTSVQRAVEDLHTCIFANEFVGTDGSSFSGEIQWTRKNGLYASQQRPGVNALVLPP